MNTCPHCNEPIEDTAFETDSCVNCRLESDGMSEPDQWTLPDDEHDG